MSSITSYVKHMSVHDVLARKSVHDVVALITYAIVQFSTRAEKEIVFKFLLDYFGYGMDEKGEIRRK